MDNRLPVPFPISTPFELKVPIPVPPFTTESCPVVILLALKSGISVAARAALLVTCPCAFVTTFV